jgi:hypothetical protein
MNMVPPTAGVREEQARCLGEAIRLLHRAGWHDYAKRLADEVHASNVVIDDGRRLRHSKRANRGKP